ncbi:MAG: hypothetical protein WBA45_11095 [Microthrixaceae bacterium]
MTASSSVGEPHFSKECHSVGEQWSALVQAVKTGLYQNCRGAGNSLTPAGNYSVLVSLNIDLNQYRFDQGKIQIVEAGNWHDLDSLSSSEGKRLFVQRSHRAQGGRLGELRSMHFEVALFGCQSDPMRFGVSETVSHTYELLVTIAQRLE